MRWYGDRLGQVACLLEALHREPALVRAGSYHFSEDTGRFRGRPTSDESTLVEAHCSSGSWKLTEKTLTIRKFGGDPSDNRYSLRYAFTPAESPRPYGATRVERTVSSAAKRGASLP